jgi:hypothetical protein
MMTRVAGVQTRCRCEYGLAVGQATDRVRQDDDIERTTQRVVERGVFGVAKIELQFRRIASCDFEHRRTEIDANAARWPQALQQPTSSASDVEHALTLIDQKPHVSQILMVVERIALDPSVAFGRHLLCCLICR